MHCDAEGLVVRHRQDGKLRKAMKDYLATIVKNKQIANGVYSITFRVDEDVQVRCENVMQML